MIMNKKKLIIPLMIFTALFTGCGSSETDDEPDHDDLFAPLENEFEFKEGTYQKKNSDEKIVLIDQKHFQFVGFDYNELLDNYAVKYKKLDWAPPADGLEKLKQVNTCTSMILDGRKWISTEIFEDLQQHETFEYFDTDGYSLVYNKEEYFLIDEDEN